MNRKVVSVFLFIIFSGNVQAAEYALYSDEKISLLAEIRDFNPENHEIKYIDNGSSKPIIASIDGGLPFGIKPIRLPQTEITNLILKIGEKSYRLETEGMYNPGVKGLVNSNQIFVACFGEEDCIIRMLLSDAATAYVVEWVIKFGVGRRTILTNQRDVLHNMMSNIKPPIFEE